jgi:hypothetical protein
MTQIDYRSLKISGVIEKFGELRRGVAEKSFLRPLEYGVIALVLISPLFVYYKVHYGSAFYPQRIVLYDYHSHYTEGKWIVDIDDRLNRTYEIPEGFSYFSIFDSVGDLAGKMWTSIRRIFLPSQSNVQWGFLKFPNFIYALLYLVGVVLCVFSSRGRALLGFVVGYGAPFLIMGFLPELNVRFFIPIITLAYVITGFAGQEIVKTIGSSFVKD